MALRLRAVLLFAALFARGAPVKLLQRMGVSGLRSKIAEVSTLLPKSGPGLMEMDDAMVSEQAPGTEQDTVLTPAQAIKGLYIAFNDRDADKVASFLTEDCVYEDLLLGPSTVCRGREAFVNALRFHPAFVSNKLFKDNPFGALFPDVVIEVDSIAEGVDTVGVEWHVQVKGDDNNEFPFPLGRGLSQAKVCRETGKIERVVDIAEAPWRILGVALLPLIQAAQLTFGFFQAASGGGSGAAQPAAAVAPRESLSADAIAALFDAIDVDGSGCLDRQEVGQAASKLGLPFASDDELTTFFARLDLNGDGRVTRSEFITALTALGSEE